MKVRMGENSEVQQRHAVWWPFLAQRAVTYEIPQVGMAALSCESQITF
jgi:hypothetical protein